MREMRIMAGRQYALFALLAGLLAFAAPVHGDESERAPTIRKWLESGPPEECVDILFVGDGYQRKHLSRSGKYWRDVNRYAKRLFKERPFSTYKKMFNVRALLLESKDAGCIGGSPGKHPETALKSRFQGDRFLRFGDDEALRRLVEGALPVDIVFVMVNSERYGGGGTRLDALKRRGRAMPAPTFSARDTLSFLVAVHELGHSFAGLADEYVEGGKNRTWPLPAENADLAAANVTVAAHIDPTSFATVAETAKWKRFLGLRGAKRWTWAYEGGYYRKTGVYRPFPKCMMNELKDPFCPVCCEALAKAIFETCGKPWDAEAHDKAHPLGLWK